MKNSFILLIVIVAISVGCTKVQTAEQVDVSKTVNNLEAELHAMKDKQREDNKMIVELKGKVEQLERENENIKEIFQEKEEQRKKSAMTYYLANRFIEAYLNQDIKGMQALLADNISVDNEFIRYDYEGEKIKLKNNKKEMDYRLNSYEVEDDSVFYSFMVYEEPSQYNRRFI